MLITGGWLGSDIYVSYLTHDVYLYDPGSRQFTPAGQLKVARELHTATLLPDGTVLIAGGDTRADNDDDFMDSAATNLTETFAPKTITAGPTLKTARSEHTATLLPDGGVLLVGGFLSGGSRTEIYH